MFESESHNLKVNTYRVHPYQMLSSAYIHIFVDTWVLSAPRKYSHRVIGNLIKVPFFKFYWKNIANSEFSILRYSWDPPLARTQRCPRFTNVFISFSFKNTFDFIVFIKKLHFDLTRLRTEVRHKVRRNYNHNYNPSKIPISDIIRKVENGKEL